jgi:hypothetical protein
MAGLSWVLSAQVSGLAALYLVYGCLGGLGTGIVYIGVVGLMVRWFPASGDLPLASSRQVWHGGDYDHLSCLRFVGPVRLEQTMTVFGILFAAVGFSPVRG